MKTPENQVVSYTIEDRGAGLRAVFRSTQPISPALDPLGICIPHSEEFPLTADGVAQRIKNLEMQGEDASLSRQALQELQYRSAKLS